MSYSIQGREVRTALIQPGSDEGRGVKGGGEGDAAYVRDSQKVQEAVKLIQQHSSDIRKEACLVGTSSSYPSSKGKVQNSVRAAKSTAEDAKRLLQGLAVTGGTSNERDLRRLTQQKLRENLLGASKGLEAAWKQYELAEAEASKRREVSNAIPHGSSASGVEMGEIAHEADIDEARLRGLQRRTLEDVAQSEIETHAAIADEYVTEFRNLEQDIKGLQRVMVDLAEHTQSQGESLDHIEANTSNSAHRTGEATEQLVIAHRYQRSRNKRLIWLLLFVFILTVSVIIVVAHQAS